MDRPIVDNSIYSLSPSSITKEYLRQNISFWIFLLYLVFEYLRPQSMYPSIDVIPWTQTIIILLLIAIIAEGKFITTRNKANVYIHIYLFVVIVSSVLAFSPAISFQNIRNFIVLYLVYFLTIYSIDRVDKYFLFILFYLLINFKLSLFTFQLWVSRGFDYDKYGATAGMAWLKNSGEFAIQMCIIFSISSYLLISLWESVNLPKKILLLLVPITCFGSVIACGSRGGMLGLAVVIIVMFLWSKKKIWGVIMISLVVLSAPFLLAERDIERFQNIGSVYDTTGMNRLERWSKGIIMFKENPVFGVGFENWAEADWRMFNGTGAECHNIFIECISELGLAGLVTFLMLLFYTFKNNRETRELSINDENRFVYNMAKSLDIALIAYLVTGFFVTVLYYPYFWVNLGMTVALNTVAKKKYAESI